MPTQHGENLTAGVLLIVCGPKINKNNNKIISSNMTDCATVDILTAFSFYTEY